MSNGQYNVYYDYEWKTHVPALPMHIKDWIDNHIDSNWGWYFIPHENMNYQNEDWHKDQTLVITFKQQADLVKAKLCIELTN